MSAVFTLLLPILRTRKKPQPTSPSHRKMGPLLERELRVLCFGDSLTEGFTRGGMRWAPYSKTFGEVVQGALDGREGGGKVDGEKRDRDEKFGGGEKVEDDEVWKVSVDTRGVSGEMVGGSGMRGRMARVYSSPQTLASPYDLVLFLGGTNDLGNSRPALSIFSDIKDVIDVPLQLGARVVLMTVPECGYRSESLDRSRDELNGLIRGFAKEREGDGDVFLFDLNKKIPYHSMGEKERKEVWDDGLHLTAKGYERLGRMVGERVLEIVGARGSCGEGTVEGLDEKV